MTAAAVGAVLGPLLISFVCMPVAVLRGERVLVGITEVLTRAGSAAGITDGRIGVTAA